MFDMKLRVTLPVLAQLHRANKRPNSLVVVHITVDGSGKEALTIGAIA